MLIIGYISEYYIEEYTPWLYLETLHCYLRHFMFLDNIINILNNINSPI